MQARVVFADGHQCLRTAADMRDTGEIAGGGKLVIDATTRLPGEGSKLPWPLLIRMSRGVRKRIDVLFQLR